MVRAPPCHGGGRRFESDLGRFLFTIVKRRNKRHCLHDGAYLFIWRKLRRHGGIGRRKGLKIPREQSRTGSSPVAGIIKKEFFLSECGEELFFILGIFLCAPYRKCIAFPYQILYDKFM